MIFKALTHLSIASLFWDIGKHADPDEMQHNAASHQGLHSLVKTKNNLC